MRSGRAIRAATLVVATALLSACASGGACPAVAYSTAVTVTLDAAWPDRDQLQVEVECAAADDEGACDLTGVANGPRWDGMTMSPPATVHVTVSRDGEVVLAQDDVALTVRTVDRPHGRGCPGLQAAEATMEPPR